VHTGIQFCVGPVPDDVRPELDMRAAWPPAPHPGSIAAPAPPAERASLNRPSALFHLQIDAALNISYATWRPGG